MGGVLHCWGGLTKECCSCGSTGQGTHTGEKPEKVQKLLAWININIHKKKLNKDVKYHLKCDTLMKIA